MLHFSITPYYLQVGTRKTLLIKKNLPPSNKVRQRKIIWFSPPYTVNVETNIGKNTTKYSTETMPKFATVAYLILPL